MKELSVKSNSTVKKARSLLQSEDLEAADNEQHGACAAKKQKFTESFLTTTPSIRGIAQDIACV